MVDDTKHNYEDAVTEGYCKLWGEYKQVMIGEYFSKDSLNGGAGIFDLDTECGFKGSIEEPLSNFMDQQTVIAETVEPGEDQSE
mmetsp:Transcript_3398/g.6866  ORF Transcript_3398/g.6866 Transcript_3398/m.6866 type:complete len:84 (-) Transcript_3398:3638-3889(-)